VVYIYVLYGVWTMESVNKRAAGRGRLKEVITVRPCEAKNLSPALLR
jgi:hypothetical protein